MRFVSGGIKDGFSAREGLISAVVFSVPNETVGAPSFATKARVRLLRELGSGAKGGKRISLHSITISKSATDRQKISWYLSLI